MKYDANTSNKFEAIVLTEPIRIFTDPRNEHLSGRKGKETTSKYAFMVRIVGPNSPHKFLPDPCAVEYTLNDKSRRKAFNLIQLHTKVIMDAGEDTVLPEKYDKVSISLERGEFGSFKTDIAKQFISISSKTTVPEGQPEYCSNLEDFFAVYDGSTLDSIETEIYVGTYVPGDRSPNIENVQNGSLQEAGIILKTPSDKDSNGNTIYTSRAGDPLFIPEAISSFEKLAADYYKHFKEPLMISSHYRSIDQQIAMKAQKKAEGKPGYAATPGKSFHGWGVAFDIDGTKVDTDGDGEVSNADRFNSPIYKWLDNSGRGRHGWKNPPALRQGGSGPDEAWHWENVALKNKHFKGVTQLLEGQTGDVEEEPDG